MRLVLDTNILISSLLVPNSTPNRVFEVARNNHSLLVSQALLQELGLVLQRPKFARYVSEQQREAFLTEVSVISELVTIIKRVQVCRDPKDDMILELAVDGRADCIVTGDLDLLDLGVYEDITILTPAQFLERYPRQ